MVDRFNSEGQKFADEFAKFKRDVLDRLDNIEYDSFSPKTKQLIAQSANGSAGFRASADGSGSSAEMFAEFNEALAKVEAKVDSFGSTIISLTEWRSEASSSITSIQQRADTNGAFIEMFAVSGNYDIDISRGYTYDNVEKKYIFKSKDGEDVTVATEDFAGMYISAMNNNYSTIKYPKGW